MFPFGCQFGVTVIDVSTFEVLEDMGCIFLLSCGSRDYSTCITNVTEESMGLQACYWTSMAISQSHKRSMIFDMTGNLTTEGVKSSMMGAFVRLVQDL